MAYVSQQITSMRKAGDLQGAYRLAVDAYRTEPGNKYIASALSWVLYDLLKRYRVQGNKYFGDGAVYAQSLRVIVKYQLNLADNKMFYENLLKSVVSTSWDLAKRKRVEDLHAVFLAVVDLTNIDSRFRDAILMKAFLKGFEGAPTYLVDAVRWYDVRSFTRQDYLDEEYQRKKIPGLAESVVNKYLDSLMKRDADGRPIFSDAIREEAVSVTSSMVGRAECAHWKWLEYKLGKLLIEMGRNSDARDILGPFVLRKPNDAYAWATYGESFLPDQPGMYAACIYRALHLSKDPKFALSYHEAAIALFVQAGDYPAAKLEADIVANVRYENGWRQSRAAEQAKNEAWYRENEASADNSKKYQELGANVEATLAAYVPKVEFYLEWTAPDKGLAGIDTFSSPYSYALDKAERLCLHDAAFAKSYEPGEVYVAALDKKGLKVYGEARISANSRMKRIFVKEFEGRFEPVKSFGFVHTLKEDIWIPAQLIADHEIVPFSKVSGTALATYHKKKGEDVGKWSYEPRIAKVIAPDPEEYKTEVEGQVRIAGGGFGFVEDDYFISPRLVTECDLRDGDFIKAAAVKSWNKKKRQWGWSVDKIRDRIDIDDGSGESQ